MKKATQKQYFTDRELAERFGVGRATIWRWLSTGHLPKPVRLSVRCTRWRAADIALFESEGDL